MSIEIHPLPAFEDNYIWAIQSGDAVAVVDPGESAPVLRHLERTGARLVAILVTHRHGDHTEGIAALTAHAAVPVFGPALENIVGVTHPLRGGETAALPELGITFEVIAVPGHTRGHIAYYAPAGPTQGGMRPLRRQQAGFASVGESDGRRGWLFCGDVLFGGGCGRVFEGTMAEMQSSLARLAALPPDTAVYCAHEYTQSNLRFARAVEPGNPALLDRTAAVAKLRAEHQPTVPSTLAEELATNPFLRWDAPAVIAAAGARRGSPPGDAVEVFAAIREWKNGF
jgi:hydroxyacylglutathione hydrolase